MNLNQNVKPYVTNEIAVELGTRLFGLNILTVKEMVSFDDRNFHLQVSPECRNPHISEIWPHGYTLKITNPQKSSFSGHFESMHAMMKHLNSKGMTLPCPVPNVEGSTWTIEEIPGEPATGHKEATEGKRRKYMCGVHLLTYLPGVTVGSISHGEDVLYQWGHLLAHFHDALQDFSHPTLENKIIFWDLSHIPEVDQYMDGLSPQRQILVSEVLASYADAIQPKICYLRKGLLHGDFNENNIIVRTLKDKCYDSSDHLKKYVVDGILDLEDIHYGTYVWDVSVMLAYTMLNCFTIDPLEGAGYALAGYLSRRSLTDEEISLLKIGIACRLAQSAVLGAYVHKIYPTNTYLVDSQKEKWSRLENVWSIPTEILVKKWEDIRKRNISRESEFTKNQFEES